MELPYINGKTIKTLSTIGYDGSIDEVRIDFKDGSTLVLTGEYITLTFEPAAAPAQAACLVITPTTRWPGE